MENKIKVKNGTIVWQSRFFVVILHSHEGKGMGCESPTVPQL